jgi:hypothetical protein
MERVHIKRYSKKLFESNKQGFESRSKVLESLGGTFKCLRKHSFYESGDYIEVETEYIENRPLSAGRHLLEQLTVLAHELNQINASIPHGDIVQRNVLYNGSDFVLVDWEPLLEYGAPPATFFKSTKPYISKLDVKNSKITSNTDKIAFFYFCRKQLHGWFPTEPNEPLKLESTLTSQGFDDLVFAALKMPKKLLGKTIPI